MEVKFEGTCIFEGDPIDEVLGLNSNAAEECAVSEQERMTTMAIKVDKEIERQECINKWIDVIAIIIFVVIFVIAAVPIIHSLIS